MLKFEFIPYQLRFSFDAKTSRGSLKTIETVLIKAIDENGATGWGECCRIPGLSIDESLDYLNLNATLIDKLSAIKLDSKSSVLDQVSDIIPENHVSLKMGMETVLLDLMNGGERRIFNDKFHSGDSQIHINGLIWMGHSEDMLKQINERLYEGFDCIKLKIGGIDFDVECDILDYVRRRYFKQDLTIRLDANGSFEPNTALNKLHRLAAFNIHSIEQPLKPGNKDLPSLVQDSPIPIALDEELIGVHDEEKRSDLLETIKPDYLVLKPSLLGGFKSTQKWIELAEEKNIKWWITSALESNIGLNAIAQFTANYDNPIPQGLGTGRLYDNNISSPLIIKDGNLLMGTKHKWNFDLNQDIDE